MGIKPCGIPPPHPCRPACDYTILKTEEKIYCSPGGGSYVTACLYETETLTRFHDSKLQETTKKINALLEEARETGEGRSLAFLRLPEGTFLAWIEQDAPDDLPQRSGRVTADSDIDDIARALGLDAYIEY